MRKVLGSHGMLHTCRNTTGCRRAEPISESTLLVQGRRYLPASHGPSDAGKIRVSSHIDTE